MPYEKTDAKLEELVKQALADPEINEGMKEARLEESDALAEIKKRSDEVWGGVSSEIARYETTEKEIQSKKEEIRTSLGVPSDLDDDAAYAKKEPPGWITAVGAIGIFGGIGAVIALVKTYSLGGWKLKASIGAALTAAICFVIFYIRFYIFEKDHQRKNEIRRRWKDRLNEKYESEGANRLEEDLKNQEQAIAKLILEKKIKPLIREHVINPRLEPSYEPYFTITKAPGLAEAFDPSQTIDTTAKKSLAFHLNNMSGGSIGIAGPRGAGKSTLIRSYCGEKRTVASSKDEKLVTVLVSAPVEYQARDFILYLFSAVCNSVLEKLGKPFDPSVLREETQKESPIATVRSQLPTILRAFFYAGLLLAIVSVVIAAIQVSSPTQPTQQQSAQQQSAQQTTSTDLAPSGSTTPSSTSSGPTSPNTTTQPALMRLLSALEIKPGSILTLGITLLTLSLVLGVILDKERRFADTLAFYLLPLSIPVQLIISRMQESSKQTEEAKPAVAEQQKSPEEKAKEDLAKILEEDTNRWLKKIRFQQSYTAGWTGAIKLPVGFESGVSNATTLAENQMSLPEITHSFTRYIEKLTREYKYKVIIGIDELDKLESDEKAQRFLNEIKSIFGLEGCFYLVSVSENAISSFERRGLPFRDVFDSSFDHIIYVDYLNFTGAKKLIQQRVIGRPIPFFAFSYCLSGGLPRDLIRTLRQLVELNQGSSLFMEGDFVDASGLVHKLKNKTDPLANHLLDQFDPATRELINQYTVSDQLDQVLLSALVKQLNNLLKGPSLYEVERFKQVQFSKETKKLIEQQPQGEDLIHLNRMLLGAAYPNEIAKNHPSVNPNALAPNSLTSLCHALIGAELKSKVRSIAFAAKRVELEKEVGDFLEEIYNIETQNMDVNNLFESSKQMLKGMSAKANPPAPTKSQNNKSNEDKEKLVQKEKLNVLREELATYIEYLATLLEFFNDKLKKDDLKKIENGDGDLDRLARARQMMAVDPEISRKYMTAFRQKTARVFRA